MPHALKLLIFALLSAALVAPAGALANEGSGGGDRPNEPVTASFEVAGVNQESRVAKVVLECVGRDYNGKGVAVKVGDGVELSAFTVGAHLAGTLDRSTDPPTVVALKDSTCGDARPKPDCPSTTTRTSDDDGCPKTDDPPAPCPAPTAGEVRAAHNDGCEKGDDNKGSERPLGPKFRPSFLNRVWRFEGAADSFEDGVLGMTVEKVKGLPRRLRDQDDELLDQDALVLVGSKTKVYGADGKRTTADSLADADQVSVRGKLLPPAKWRDDEDGQATPTLRAKRVYILS